MRDFSIFLQTLKIILIFNSFLFIVKYYSGENLKKKLNHWLKKSNFFNFINDDCKIKAVPINNDKNAILRSFQGPELIKFYEKLISLDFISLKEKFSFNFENLESIYQLWCLFYEIYKEIISEGASDYTWVKNKTKEWNEKFRSTYVDPKATPYIHYFCCHLWQDVKKYGDMIKLLSKK